MEGIRAGPGWAKRFDPSPSRTISLRSSETVGGGGCRPTPSRRRPTLCLGGTKYREFEIQGGQRRSPHSSTGIGPGVSRLRAVGEEPKREMNGAPCKGAGTAFAGSNPASPTYLRFLEDDERGLVPILQGHDLAKAAPDSWPWLKSLPGRRRSWVGRLRPGALRRPRADRSDPEVDVPSDG